MSDKNELRFKVQKSNRRHLLGFVLLPTACLHQVKVGKFKFYCLSVFWLRFGYEFSVGRGPFTIAQARMRNIMEGLNE